MTVRDGPIHSVDTTASPEPVVAGLRRYPVKSMGGEGVARLDLDQRGAVGDRRYAVVDAEGRFASGKDTRRFRRRDEVFDYAAATTAGGEVEVRRAGGRWLVGDEALDADLHAHLGAPARVLAEQRVSHFDAGAVSLVGTATLEWCRRELGVDADQRRLRANLLISTHEPFEEEDWVGGQIALGGAGAEAATVLRLVERIERCRTIDLAQDGVPTTTKWLKALGRTRELCMGVYADVVRPGPVQLGDPVRVLTS